MSSFRILAIGQAIFFTCIVVCTISIPHFAETGGGISNYGLYAKTIPFFTVGFIVNAATVIWAGAQSTNHQFRRNFFILGILLLAVMASTYPYKINSALDILHQAVSQLLFVFEVGLSAWLAFWYRPEVWIKVLFGAQCISALIGLLTILGAFHLLFISQILTGLCFGGLLLRASQRTV